MLLFTSPIYSHFFFFPSLDSSSLSLDSYKDKDLAKFASFHFPFIETLPSPLEIARRIWTVFTLATAWVTELITRVMFCFDLAHKKQVSNQPIIVYPKDKLDDPEKLADLFQQSIDYETFRYKVLTYKNLFYNNYGYNAFIQIKEAKLGILDNCKTEEEKELKASMAVYDAIVNLYIERFCARYPELNDEKYLPCLRTIALSIAIKISWDESIDNVNFQHFIIPYMGYKSHGMMESAFLKAINWNTSINELSIHDTSETSEEEDFEY
jgi:hypothetical protein